MLTVVIALVATGLLLLASTSGDPSRSSAWPTLALVAVAMSIGAIAVLRAWNPPDDADRADQPRPGSDAGSDAGPT
jgi:hypothetical protein